MTMNDMKATDGVVEADAAPGVEATPAVAPLREVKYVQNIGRFEKGKSVADATFGLCTLVFGENGWGKSTLADLLRSLTTNNPDIVVGRKTLAGGPEQQAVMRLGDQHAVFKNGAWTGIRPRIAVYDSVFVNENVFSGDVVTNEHLKNQYGMVVGEEGVLLVRRIVELDNENRENNIQSRVVEAELSGIVRAVGPEGMTHKEFLALEAIANVDKKIEAKKNEVQRASRTKELKAAAEPRVLPVPTETEEFRKCLHGTIEGIAEAAARAVRAHIAKHDEKGPGGARSSTKAGWNLASSSSMRKSAPFAVNPFTTVPSSNLTRSFSAAPTRRWLRKSKPDATRLAGMTRASIGAVRRKSSGKTRHCMSFGKGAGQIEAPQLEGIEAAIDGMETAARLLDNVFIEKQGNLTEAATGGNVEAAILAWDEGRKEIVRLNGVIEANVAKIKALKESLDEAELPRLVMQLKTLQAREAAA